MAPLTFADTHNMVAYLSKSDASEGFDQILDFLNTSTIRYALTVNPTIYVSCIKQFWSTAKVKTVNGVVQLQALIDGKKVFVSEAIIRRDLHLEDAEGVKCLPNNEIFKELARMVDDMTSHHIKYTSPALTQKVFANMRRVGKGFSGNETPLFDTMLVQPQTQEDEDVEMPVDEEQLATTSAPSTSEHKDQPSTPSLIPPEQELLTHHPMIHLSLRKVGALEKDKCSFDDDIDFRDCAEACLYNFLISTDVDGDCTCDQNRSLKVPSLTDFNERITKLIMVNTVNSYLDIAALSRSPPFIGHDMMVPSVALCIGCEILMAGLVLVDNSQEH
ncbi:hypothetical protein Tco_0905626 [Tanacetum coccineum]